MGEGIRKRGKIIILAACLLAVLSVVVYHQDRTKEMHRYSRLKRLTTAEYEQITRERTLQKAEQGLAIEMLYQDNAIPYDRFTNTFMRTEGIRDHQLQVEAAEPKEATDHGGAVSIARLPQKDGLIAYTDSTYTEYYFWETQVPVIVLHTDGQEIADEEYQDISMSVYGDGAAVQSCVNMTAGIHTRGASSSWIPKKSYRIKLEAVENHVGNKYGFFGMRPAQEWVLLSLYGDESKMREKLARDLWDDIAANSSYADAGTGLELTYCEVYLDDEYVGLYGMGTAVDRENYWQEKSKDSQDLLFKAIHFIAPAWEDILETDAATEAVACLELKYASWTSEDMWQTIGAYMDLAYYAPDEDYLREMKDYMHVDNHIDYWLFFLAAGLDDNELKNIYFSITDARNNKEVLLTPWDMDMAWGVGYTGEDIFMWGRNENQYKKILDFPIVSRMFALQDKEMIAKTKQRWEALRHSIITEENILNRIRENYDQVWESGIIERDMAKWPEAKYASDIEYIEEYVLKRLPYLDQYMAQLGEGEWDDGWE